MSDPIDWGNLIELYRECNKPIRKDENRFYEFSSTVYMNFGAIIKERESQAKRIAELESGLQLAVDANARFKMLWEEVTAERDALKVDAERYRWLRQQCGSLSVNGHTIAGQFEGQKGLFDEFIDAAIKEQQ